MGVMLHLFVCSLFIGRLSAYALSPVSAYASRGLPCAAASPTRRAAVLSRPQPRISLCSPQPTVCDLPDSFEQSVGQTWQAICTGLQRGQRLLRVDYDTSAGDETYDKLKRSLPVAKELTNLLGLATQGLDPTGLFPAGLAAPRGAVEEEGTPLPPTVRVVMPDEGSAAMIRNLWNPPEHIKCVSTNRCEVQPTDCLVFFVAPVASEADTTMRILKELEASDAATAPAVIMLNPNLVNMETTGYGSAGRSIRNFLDGNFQQMYLLRTTSWGAVCRQFPLDYGIWMEDSAATGGYRLIGQDRFNIPMDQAEEMFVEAAGLQGGDGPGFLGELSKFINGFSKL